MTARPIDDLVPLVAASLTGAPAVLIIRQLVVAARAFCRRSRWWQHACGPAGIVAGITDYRIDAPVSPPSAVHAIEALSLDGRALRAADGFHDLGSGHLRLARVPATSRAEALTGAVSLVPLATADSLDADLVERWGEAIADGARAALLLAGGQPWRDPALGLKVQAEFDSAIAAARADRLRRAVAAGG